MSSARRARSGYNQFFKLKLISDIECWADDHVWPDVTQYNWHFQKDLNGKLLYPMGRVDNQLVFLHRYIYEKYVGPIPEDKTVDHIISTNKFDVRLKNLRLGDPALQGHNKINIKQFITAGLT